MKAVGICLSLVLSGSLCTAANIADLAEVKSVYLLSMGNALDQYLATHLARTNRFQVVTDPQLADALLTDRLGEGFERRYTELYPPPKPPEPKEEDDKDKKGKKSESGNVVRDEQSFRISSFGRGKGNVYLVDRRTRRVVWSEYVRPKNTTPDELSKTADRIIDKLMKDVQPK